MKLKNQNIIYKYLHNYLNKSYWNLLICFFTTQNIFRKLETDNFKKNKYYAAFIVSPAATYRTGLNYEYQKKLLNNLKATLIIDFSNYPIQNS